MNDVLRVLAAIFAGGFLGRLFLARQAMIEPLDLRVEGAQKLAARERQTGKKFKRDAPRPLSDIDSVVLHQMGFSRGPDPAKYLGVPAHYVVMPDGVVAQLHDWETYLYTSNALNRRSIGVEIAGNFANEDGKWWNPERFGRDKPTAEQLAAIRGLLRYIDRELQEQKGKLRGVYAHRQSSAAKRNDPGPEVWRAVSPVFAELGLEDVSEFSIDSGAPIPDSWRSESSELA